MAEQKLRTSRATSSRAADEQQSIRNEMEDIDFSPATLDTRSIPPRDGFVQRWVRTKVGNEDDASNVFRNANVGWKPRLAETVPKGALVPTVGFNGNNVIGVHDMILMERPVELDERHKAYIKGLTDNQMAAVNNELLKVHDPSSGMGRPENKSSSSVSKGRVAPVSPD